MGRDTALDVTVMNPLETELFSRAALKVRFDEKMTKHGEGCRLAGMAFMPMAVKTLGGMEGGRSLRCCSSRTWAQPWPGTPGRRSLRRSDTSTRGWPSSW